MKTSILSLAAASAALMGAAMAEECELNAQTPEMPNPKEATAEDRAATLTAIKDYQAALGVYRECLDTVVANEELEVEVRQAALESFNKTVETETKMVENWQKFDKKYQKENS
ncbi:hypothetical protein [Hyphococcus sp.]|uniref:hypothetical protein n=1 Tax=Hyphococcus sp. TaxID=2038636 RepID=UPI003CCC071D